ncbi:putative Transmembrane protein [Quillaja saponaria]|uniref:Transmembrane protein n=1 Tax=Quillaja saponaria TaxID=32244 RepID=A0AAD7LKX0_QUISA|nr:putative Transmembrane protein [Quillaja saponaria]
MAVDLVTTFPVPFPTKKLGQFALYPPEAQYLIIRLPHFKFMRLFARALLLALLIVSLPWVRSVARRSSFYFSSTSRKPISDIDTANLSSDSINLRILPLLFRDLANEGLVKKMGEKAVFVSNNKEENSHLTQIISKNISVEMISVTDSEQQSSVPNESFDFAFTFNFPDAAQFIDRTLKTGGVVTVVLGDNPSAAFYKPANYKIAYLRRFDSTVVAMRKTGLAGSNSATQRKLCGYASEAKKAALKKLEDVLLEPPRAASGKSKRYLKKTRYLPDLMGDSLESYPRRVFIDVGLPEKEGGSGTGWFPRHYPTRNKDFEIYKIETVTEESSGKEVTQAGMSDWLTKNVKDEEYVVMKAEAEVVEEMMKSETIRLVDELFLECKPQLANGKGKENEGNRRSGRAYWECLALYGRLRDEGVAVHQWWG